MEEKDQGKILFVLCLKFACKALEKSYIETRIFKVECSEKKNTPLILKGLSDAF